MTMPVVPAAAATPRLGLRANLPQFSLLVLVNAFVGAMVGLERTILPALAEEVHGVSAKAGVLSFLVAFGVAKALANYAAGRLSDRVGRKPVLVAGWLVAAPVPFLLMAAPSWSWVVAANVLLGVSQGLTWSTTVAMKVDLAGPERRGLAMGLNEFAGYLAVAASALATGWIAARAGLTPAPFAIGVAYVALGLGLSVLLVRETLGHVRHESTLEAAPAEGLPTPGAVFWRTTLFDRDLSAIVQGGLVNNLNDGMAWGLFPGIFAAAGLGLDAVGALVALYPAVWGVSQLGTGALSDRVGRKPLLVAGMAVQAVGIAVVGLPGVVSTPALPAFVLGQALLGFGTALVYPTFLAAIGDVAHPAWRASAMGTYRLWRDLGYAVGAVLAGLVADALGVPAAIALVAALTLGSGAVLAVRLRETKRHGFRPG